MGLIETPRQSLKEKQWKLREDTILDAASELVFTKGYNAMTMDDVSNLVGISKATLYQHFASKHDLLVSVACRTSDRAFENMSSVSNLENPRERAEALIDRIVADRFGSDSPPFIEAVGELTEILSADHPYAQKERRNIEFVAGVLEDVKKAKAMPHSLSIPVAVHVLMSALRSTDLLKSITDGTLSQAEVSASLKQMVLGA